MPFCLSFTVKSTLSPAHIVHEEAIFKKEQNILLEVLPHFFLTIELLLMC